jgi:fluoride ion exporter CrcB/FEX
MLPELSKTLAVNAMGCLAFGYLWEWSRDG